MNTSFLILVSSTGMVALVAPYNATDKSITWSSSDESVATVENGVITTVAPGTTTITATANDGSNVSATCELTVTAIEAKTCWGVGNDFTFQENPVSYYYSITRNADRTLTVHVEFSRDIQGLGNLNVVWGDAWHLMPYDQSTKTATFTTEEKYDLNTILSGPFFYFEGRRTDFSYHRTLLRRDSFRCLRRPQIRPERL